MRAYGDLTKNQVRKTCPEIAPYVDCFFFALNAHSVAFRHHVQWCSLPREYTVTDITLLFAWKKSDLNYCLVMLSCQDSAWFKIQFDFVAICKDALTRNPWTRFGSRSLCWSARGIRCIGSNMCDLQCISWLHWPEAFWSFPRDMESSSMRFSTAEATLEDRQMPLGCPEMGVPVRGRLKGKIRNELVCGSPSSMSPKSRFFSRLQKHYRHWVFLGIFTHPKKWKSTQKISWGQNIPEGWRRRGRTGHIKNGTGVPATFKTRTVGLAGSMTLCPKCFER